MKSLVWFRNDLRMDDNPALRAACAESDEIHAIYIYSNNQMKIHNEASCKIEFMIANLKSLEKSLNELNIPLTIIDSDGMNHDPSIILNLINERTITNIYWNNQFGIDEESRDRELQELLKINNINSSNYDAQVLFPAGTFKTGEGKPYSVFTPFKKRWVENFNLDLLDIEFKYTPKIKTSISSNIDSFNFSFNKDHSVDMKLWPVGENEALKNLNKYLDKKIFNYAKDRNDPIIEGTSRLSPYLSLGIISPKRCILEALKKK